MASHKILITDIDGCMVDYPQVFLNWLADQKNLKHHSLSNLKRALNPEEYERMKHDYRTSGVKRQLEIVPGARETLQFVVRQKIEIWVVTTRPNIEPVASDTKHWLDHNKIPYAKLFFTVDKVQFIKDALAKGVQYVIDDDFDVVNLIGRDTKLNVFYFNKRHLVVDHSLVRPVTSWAEIYGYFQSN